MARKKHFRFKRRSRKADGVDHAARTRERSLRAAAADRADFRRRASFRTKGAVAASLVGSLLIAALSWQWSALIGISIVLGFGVLVVVHVVGPVVESMSLIALPILAALACCFIVHQFSISGQVTRNERIGAIAKDGAMTSSTSYGTASHHGGVRQWLTQSVTASLTTAERWHRAFVTSWGLIPFLVAIPVFWAERRCLGRKKAPETDPDPPACRW